MRFIYQFLLEVLFTDTACTQTPEAMEMTLHDVLRTISTRQVVTAMDNKSAAETVIRPVRPHRAASRHSSLRPRHERS